MNLNLERFGDELQKEIVVYSFLNKILISNLTWEERVYNALLYSGVSPEDIEWTPGSHKSGKDIGVYNLSFSCKSMVTERGVASLSSFRTTTFETLEDKIDFIDNSGKNFSHYLIAARTHGEDSLIYRAYMIDANYIRASKYEWEETYGKTKRNLGKFTGWQTNYVDGIKLKIAHNMSDQLWIYMDTNGLYNDDGVRVLTEVSIKHQYLGAYWKSYRDGVLNARRK